MRKKISDIPRWKEGCIFDKENSRVYLPHGDNEYSASGLFHLSGIRALDYQTLKHTIEMQPVPEKHFMCDFAIAVAGNPNQRVSSGDSESSRLGADAIKVVIKKDEVSLGSDRLQGTLLAAGQDNCPSLEKSFWLISILLMNLAQPINKHYQPMAKYRSLS